MIEGIVEDRHGHAADEQAGDFTGHEGDGQPLEDRIGQDHRGTDDGSAC